MMPGSWATYRGQLVQVLRIEGGKSRNWGGSRRTPKVWTLVPYGNPEGTYTVTDPSSADLRPAQPPEGYQPPPLAEGPRSPRFYTSGKPW
jgi:hypothetical protein